MIALLVRGLRLRGHEVTLFANAESTVECEVVRYPRRSGSRVATLTNAWLIARELRHRRPDIVHSFGRLAQLVPILSTRVPKVMSYQRTVTPASVRAALRLARGSLSFTGCSRALIRPVESLGSWSVIYNAVAVDRYRCSSTVPADAPLVFLGRIESIKGPHVAIEAARRSGRRLIIAGNVPEADEHQRFFREAIEPHVDGRTVVYVGPVDDAAKNELLGGAAALLMPVLWDEPFGIVMAEALACGTPVIGFNRGAVPEVVDDGVTGFVTADVESMTRAIGRLAGVERPACRAAAERRFSERALIDAHEALYMSRTGRGH